MYRWILGFLSRPLTWSLQSHAKSYSPTWMAQSLNRMVRGPLSYPLMHHIGKRICYQIPDSCPLTWPMRAHLSSKRHCNFTLGAKFVKHKFKANAWQIWLAKWQRTPFRLRIYYLQRARGKVAKGASFPWSLRCVIPKVAMWLEHKWWDTLLLRSQNSSEAVL